MPRRSAPASSRCVANECRSACGWRLSTPARRPARSTSRRTVRSEYPRPPGVEEQRPLEPRRRGEPRAHGLHRRRAHRDPAVLPSLAPSDPDEVLVEVEVGPVERAQLAHPQPGAVQDLEDRAIPDRGTGLVVEELLGLGRRHEPRQVAPDLRRLEIVGDGGRDLADLHHPAVERPDRGDVSGQRRGRPVPAGLEQERAQVDLPRVHEGPAADAQPILEPGQGPIVGATGVRARTPLDLQVVEEPLSQRRFQRRPS